MAELTEDLFGGAVCGAVGGEDGGVVGCEGAGGAGEGGGGVERGVVFQL